MQNAFIGLGKGILCIGNGLIQAATFQLQFLPSLV